MKKLLTIFIFLALAATGFSQIVHFAVKGGINLSTQQTGNALFDVNNSTIVGFNIGGVAAIDFDKFTLQPGLFFTTKGERVIIPDPFTTATYNAYYTLDYIEIPVDILYKRKLGPKTTVHFGLGLYLATGVYARVTYPGTSNRITFDNNTANLQPGYQNPDYGLNFLAGMQLNKKIAFDAGYDLGLANLYFSNTTTLRNRTFSVSMGYSFR